MDRRSFLALVTRRADREEVPSPPSPAVIYQAAGLLRRRIEAALAASRLEAQVDAVPR